MPIAPQNNTPIPDKRSIPLFIAVVAFGLAGNYFKFPIFLNIDFLFGSIFAMLALQLVGLGRGVLAAAMIASFSYILWNHPYAIIIMTAEVAVVGWLMERRKIKMVLADTLYWLLVGMPLVYLFYHLVMHVPFSNVAITMIKQAVNGIANAIVARLLYTGFVLLSRSATISFSDIACNLLTFFVLYPALIMLAVSGRTDFNEIDRTIRTTLIRDGERVNHLLATWLYNRKTAVMNLADLAATATLPQMQFHLGLAKKSDTNFLRMGLLDQEATVKAYHPLLDESGDENIGKVFADRPFNQQLKQARKPMLSEVVMARIGSPRPMVAMLAPVITGGEYGGYVIGILSLEQIQDLLDKSSQNKATLYTLIDKNGTVIISNRTDQTVLKPFARDQGTLERLDAEISQWVPVIPSHTPTMERWQKSLYVAEIAVGDLAEWKLILEQPVAPFQKMLVDAYAGKLSLLFLIFLGSLVLAELLSRRSMSTLERLRLITQDLPIKLGTENREIVWPESGIKESAHLIHNFSEMADSLSEQFGKINRINQLLESRIEERTAALLESKAFSVAILDSVTSEIVVLDADGVIIAVNEPWRRFALENGVEPGKPAPFTEVGANYLTACRKSYGSASDDAALKSLEGIQAVLSGSLPAFSLEYPCHAPGRERWFTMNVTPLRPVSFGVVIVHTDITERKIIEDALKKARDEMERRVEERTVNLKSANEQLLQEMEERRGVEEQLFNSKATLAMALDGISDPLIMLDAELRIKQLNKAAMNYYALADYEQVIGKYCFEGFQGRSIPCEGCERPFSALQGYSGSYERQGKMDPERLKQVVVDVVKNESGAIEATIIRILDITQARVMDRQLIQSEKLATLGLLIAGIAHEINNPNNFIYFNTPILRSYLEFLLTIVDEYVLEHPDLQVFNRPYSFFREDCFKLLGNIEHGSVRINQIVGNLKEFVRERGKGENRRIDLKQVIEKGIFICQGRIRKTVKTFEVDIPEDLPALCTDPLAMEQVVVNLLINAIQAMDKEDSWVRLKIIGPSEPDGEVRVEVSDNGCGMDIETQKKIFDPFFTTKAAGVGTGLGLSITHRLVSELGGRIEVESEEGKGSLFRILLKATPAPLNQLTTG
jgi:signal transduction histidine kinase